MTIVKSICLGKFKTSYYSIRYICLLFVLCSYSSVASALDSATFSVDEISANNWSLQNVKLQITQLNQATPQVSLVSASLKLPEPLHNINEPTIHCQKFTWLENYVACQQGQGRFTSGVLKAHTFNFSFQVKNNKSKLTLSDLTWFDGTISLTAQEKSGKWQLNLKIKVLILVQLKAFLALDIFKITQGLADLDIELTGKRGDMQTLAATVLLDQISIQDQQGYFASEALTLKAEFNANQQKNAWQWHGITDIFSGNLYIDPIYLAIDRAHSVTLTNQGFWLPEQKKIELESITVEHTQHLNLQASAAINYQADLMIEAAELVLHIPQLKPVTPIYLAPFLESSTLEGIELQGQLDARLKLQQNALSEININAQKLTLNDTEQRFSVDQANMQINWTQQTNDTPSFINWQALQLKAIPFASGRLDFSLFDKQVKLLQHADLAVLGGIFSIQEFSFSKAENNEDSVVHFAGLVKELSLEQLSTALGWEPLTGSISGYIPAVRYQNKILSLDGELKMQLFDGELRIRNLASSGIFTNFARFYMDMEFDNFNLDTITRKFHTGNIEGKLSGVVHNLYLENWQPVSFYAWMGTPDDDDSTHKISQKAVENIASIGGSSATDVLSKGFLSLFSSFRYDKLGFGCYLYKGVCQLMGVEAIDNGFYLIKGGGLPSINVIAYNPRLNWRVLLERLHRITRSDEFIIE
ncbi:MAG: YdbH domain-containing protein [Methylococcaceae bacterium]|nr:YdbH domain-containing protein [Methylococcaceae bacterium]